MNPDSLINECLEKVLLTAFDQVAKHGWHVPIGFTRSVPGEFSYILADDPDAAEDDTYDTKELTAAVRDRVQRMVSEQEMTIAGLATNELTRFSDSPDKQTTVKITICHRDGTGVTIFYPYRLVAGRVEQDTPLEMDADENFFAQRDK